MSATGSRRLSVGMVGGGVGADIGKTHRWAMRLDDRFELVAGVFGQDVAASQQLAGELGVAAQRCYPSFLAMAESEAALRTSGDGVDLVVVATPNDSHLEIASAFLARGISVVCEKPLTLDSRSAAELVELADANGALLAVPHCYSAYAMVREAARLVRDGRLGELRYVDVEHASGWAASAVELTGQKQAGWRTDPARGGVASAAADLGTHAYHLARYITGSNVEALSAQMDTLVPGRRVYDNATVALRFDGGVPGRLWASMAATGHNHGLRIRVFGDRASLEWQHEDPHHLLLKDLDGTATHLTQGMASLSDDSSRLTRVGLGHPEGFIEAFANFYRDVADELAARRDGTPTEARELSFPTGRDGLMGVQFFEAALESASNGGEWTQLPPAGRTVQP